MEGYTNVELLEGCFTDEMIDAFLAMHNYTKDSLNVQKPSVMSELVLSIILDDGASMDQQKQLMQIKLGLLREIEDHIEKVGDLENPRYDF